MMPPAVKPILTAGDSLAERLRVFKKLAIQAQDRGDTVVELPVPAVWESSDDAALTRWESEKSRLMGQKPLFCEEQP